MGSSIKWQKLKELTPQELNKKIMDVRDWVGRVSKRADERTRSELSQIQTTLDFMVKEKDSPLLEGERRRKIEELFQTLCREIGFNHPRNELLWNRVCALKEFVFVLMLCIEEEMCGKVLKRIVDRNSLKE